MRTATLLNRGGNFKCAFKPGPSLAVVKTSRSKARCSTPALAKTGVRGKEISLTCTADDPLYFLFSPWTSLPIFPGFGNTPSLFPTSCGRNPADPEEAALSFQSAAPGISAAQWVELGSLTEEAHIHPGQWKQMRTECYQPKLQTLQHTSGSQLHQLDPDFRSWGGMWQRQLSLLPPQAYASASSHPLFASRMTMARAQGSAGLISAEDLAPHSSPIFFLASGISTASGLESSPCGRWCTTVWAAAPSTALKNSRLNKASLGLDQPADCQVGHAAWSHHVHRGNNLGLNSGGSIHDDCAPMSFCVCPISAREGTGVLYMHSQIFSSEYRGKSVPILKS